MVQRALSVKRKILEPASISFVPRKSVTSLSVLKLVKKRSKVWFDSDSLLGAIVSAGPFRVFWIEQLENSCEDLLRTAPAHHCRCGDKINGVQVQPTEGTNGTKGGVCSTPASVPKRVMGKYISVG